MADKTDFSEIISEMLMRMDRQEAVLRTVVDVQSRMLSVQEQMQRTQESILDRLERNEASFNAFANAALDHLSGIRTDLWELKTVVLTDHEERLRRLEDFMRRAN